MRVRPDCDIRVEFTPISFDLDRSLINNHTVGRKKKSFEGFGLKLLEATSLERFVEFFGSLEEKQKKRGFVAFEGAN